MAIIDKVEITVSSDGNVVHEYAVPVDDDTIGQDDVHPSVAKVVKYIEAIPGANFAINYTMNGKQDFGSADCFGFMTYVDGIKMFSPIVLKQNYQLRNEFSRVHDGDFSGTPNGWEKRAYYWTELLTTDEKPDATLEEVKAKYSKLGSIRVEVQRQKTTSSGNTSTGNQTLAQEVIPEKVLKGQALELGAACKNPEAIPNGTAYQVKCIDDGPLAIFDFQYRSRNALQILDVLPRTPEQLPLEERDPASLTPDELLELVRQQRAEREADKVKIKQEKAETNLRQLASLKREADADDDDEISIVTQNAKKPRREVAVIELLD